MSTLGRKAMKKTLERLKKEAFSNLNLCVDTFNDFNEEREEMSEEEQELLDLLRRVTFSAVRPCLHYIAALEDYGYELDEEWNKLLKSIEQDQIAQKEGKRKTSYRV